MHNVNSPLTFSITPTIKDIPKDSWDRLFGPDLVEGYGYQKTLEESGMKEFSFGYLLAKRQEKLVAVIPFFVMDFTLDTLLPAFLRKLILSLKLGRWLKMKILFLGTPAAEEFYLGITQDEDLNLFVEKALEKIMALCKKEKIRGFAFNNLSQDNKTLAGCLKEKGLIELEGLPTTLIKIETDSLQGYLNKLSHNARKDFRKKLKAAPATLTTEIRDDIGGISEKIYALYLHNFDDADVYFEVLTEEFFRNICRNMPEEAKFFITRDKDKIVAFNLCLMKGRLFIDKFIGFDPAVSHKYHLYFTTFAHNLEWCIKNGFRFYQPGITDYYPKVRLGAKLIPLHLYAKAINPFLNWLVKLTAKFIQPKNLEPALKEIEKQSVRD